MAAGNWTGDTFGVPASTRPAARPQHAVDMKVQLHAQTMDCSTIVGAAYPSPALTIAEGAAARLLKAPPSPTSGWRFAVGVEDPMFIDW